MLEIRDVDFTRPGGLSFSYDITVAAGEILAVQGPSGVGKTTQALQIKDTLGVPHLLVDESILRELEVSGSRLRLRLGLGLGLGNWMTDAVLV